ncbi:MAG: DUF6600 domain-containing protein [Ginsengibacter sp.]
MKIYYNILLVLTIGLFSCTATRNGYGDYDNSYQEYDNPRQISYQTFYDELSPYGNWINYPGYGYVWAPDQMGFQPYSSNGQWVYSSYGWTWVSNYRWGWAPFHYGRWMNDRFYGWLWVPGYEWAPAWVSWRGGGDYYGWAPLPPGYGMNGHYGSIPYNDYYFVQRRYITNPRVNNYYVDRSRNVTIINNTTIINNNITYNKNVINAGPAVRDVEQATNSTIRPVRVVDRRAPGESNISQGRVEIYKPAVKESIENKEEARPVRVFKKDALPRKLDPVSDEKNIQSGTPQRDEIDPNIIRSNPQMRERRINRVPTPIPQRMPAEVEKSQDLPVRVNEDAPRRVPQIQPEENQQRERITPAPPVRNFPVQEPQQERRIPQPLNRERTETEQPRQIQQPEMQPATRPAPRVERENVQQPVRVERVPVQREFKPLKETPVKQDE